jgi:endonuclease-3
MAEVNWKKAIQPLLKKYKSKKHPLDYQNFYQLVVMVVLGAQESDRHINQVVPPFFEAFQDMPALAKADEAMLHRYLRGVRNFANKTRWLLALANAVKDNHSIPTELNALTALPGIGRKSANVILHEMGLPAEGIIVDLHVVRVAPRLGIASGNDPKKLEKQLMEAIAPADWGEAGMAISFLGRETCRPTQPKCDECVMNTVCAFHRSSAGSKKNEKGKQKAKKK